MYARLRSTGGTSRLDFARSREALDSCVRQFSTTSIDAAEKGSNFIKPNERTPTEGRQRSREAAGEISNLLRNSSGRPATAPSAPTASGTSPKVVGLHFGRGSFRGSFRGNTQGSAFAGRGDGPIARAPAGFGSGRGGRPSGPGRGSFGGGGLNRGGRSFGPGRGGRGGRGGGLRGRGGGRRGGRGGRAADGQEGEDDQAAVNLSPLAEIQRFITPRTASEVQYQNELKHGVATPFNPSLTLESLTGYGPAIAADGDRAKGESLLQGLRALGGGAVFAPEANDWGVPRHTAVRLKHKEGIYFFSDLKERDHLLSDPASVAKLPDGKIPEPEENVKRALMDAVVHGAYEKPAEGTHGSLVKSETWNAGAIGKFEAKFDDLMSRAPVKKGGKPQGHKK